MRQEVKVEDPEREPRALEPLAEMRWLVPFLVNREDVICLLDTRKVPFLLKNLVYYMFGLDEEGFNSALQWLPSQRGLLEVLPQRQRVMLFRIS